MKFVDDNVLANVGVSHLYSYHCTGANKDRTTIRIVLSLSDSGRFKMIVCRPPIRGHSYLPGEGRVCGLVKRKLNKCDQYNAIKDVCEITCLQIRE